MRTHKLINSDALKAVKRQRKDERGLPITDDQIAQAIGRTRQSVSALFNGKTASLEMLALVCSQLGVDYRDYLITDILEKLAA
jgi:transcriptional regulator with XRE-family HTH domain